MRAADLFAGAGGFTEGATRAGLDVVYAANHWDLAVRVHESRHPDTLHSCQDLRQADFRALPEIDVLLASPACQGHSNAGQGARGRWGLNHSHHNSDRSTAWAVIDAVEAKRPELVVVENVPQFASWDLFEVWLSALDRLGYETRVDTFDAADFGVAQNRRRLIVTAGLAGAPSIENPRRDWTPASAVLDVDGGGGWASVSSKTVRVRERVANGRRNHGEVFLSQHVTRHPGRSLDRPLPTVTCASGQLAIVNGDRMRLLEDGELLAAQGFDRDHLAGVDVTRAQAAKLAGNAIPVQLAEEVCRQLVA